MKLLLMGLLFLFSCNVLTAQWTTSGDNAYNTNIGNVGIGTINPTQKLQLNGNFDISQFSFIRSSRIYFNAANSVLNGNTRGIFSNNIIWDTALNVWRVPSGGGSLDFAMIRYQASGHISFFNAPITQTDTIYSNDAMESYRRMTIFNNGNIGIGTNDTKGYKLAVNGDGIFNKVVVQTYPWPDYVFEPSYNLPSLQSVEAYVRQYRHLPGVPAANDVAQKGVDIGGTQAILLKKIEELTLYIINQNRQLEALGTANKEQQSYIIKQSGRLNEQSVEISTLKQNMAEMQHLLKELSDRINKK